MWQSVAGVVSVCILKVSKAFSDHALATWIALIVEKDGELSCNLPR
jgi:hypothetical protein